MLHWLHSLLPHFPHYGYVLVFIVVFLNNVGLPLPGETILLGAGFVLGKTMDSMWQPMLAGTVACFLGGNCAFWLGRRLGQGGLEKIRCLHLSTEKMKWPERFFEPHGAKSIFIARFIPLFPPVAANLLAGMGKMRLRIFLFYNITGSAAYTVTYVLIGYFFGKQWKRLETWMGPTALYLILTGFAIIVLSIVFRHSLSRFLACAFPRNTQRK
jgi:membrane-associated protein